MFGWVVGKSDFNENPVVSPGLDLDLGFVNSDLEKFGKISLVLSRRFACYMES